MNGLIARTCEIRHEADMLRGRMLQLQALVARAVCIVPSLANFKYLIFKRAIVISKYRVV